MYENLSLRLLQSALDQKSSDQVYHGQDNREVIKVLEALISKKKNNRPEEYVTQGEW
jgi:uncharacterized protein YqeY